MTIVKIKVREVGQKFAEVAVVRDARHRRKLHETSEVPYGFGAQAYAAAKAWAEARGHRLVDDDLPY